MKTEKIVTYCRVSTGKQESRGKGLDDQKKFIHEVLKRDGIAYDVVGEFSEATTGTDLKGCKKLWEAIALCKEQDATLVIAFIDRFRDLETSLQIFREMDGQMFFAEAGKTADMDMLKIFIMFAERWAKNQRIKTKIALERRKEMLATNGSFVSKSGVVCERLGNAKGCDMSAARAASSFARTNKSNEFWSNNLGVNLVESLLKKGMGMDDIIDEFNRLREKDPANYSTPKGCAMNKYIFYRYKRYLGL